MDLAPRKCALRLVNDEPQAPYDAPRKSALRPINDEPQAPYESFAPRG